MQLKDIPGDHVFTVPVAGQSTAATPDEFEGLVAPFDMKITRVRWVPTANITANATNFFTATVRNRGTDASGTAVAASRSYAATNSLAHVPEDCTLSSTPADLDVAEGDLLTVEKLVTGTGLSMPDGLVQVHAQVR